MLNLVTSFDFLSMNLKYYLDLLLLLGCFTSDKTKEFAGIFPARGFKLCKNDQKWILNI